MPTIQPPTVRTAPPASHGARAALREATASRHATLDAAMPLALPQPTLADYATHLALLRDWLAALDALFPGRPRIAQDRAAIADDLAECAALGVPVPAPATPQGTPAQAALAQLGAGPHADAAVWGVEYVIAGSHLGGRVLHRRLAERLAPHALGFLRGPADGAAPDWGRFLHALEAALPTAPDRAAASQAACATFDLLIALCPSDGLAMS